MTLFRVSSHSNPNSTAGAIAGVVRETGAAELQTIGAGALNQAIKAVAIARTFLASDGIELVCVPSFAEVFIEGQLRTAIRLALHDRQSTVNLDEASAVTLDPVSESEISASSPESGSRAEMDSRAEAERRAAGGV